MHQGKVHSSPESFWIMVQQRAFHSFTCLDSAPCCCCLLLSLLTLIALQPLIMMPSSLAACRIVHYAKFVEGLKDAEEAPGCEHCTDNRLLLEHAWQVVANEFYDPAGKFSQAKWADQLLRTFEVALMLVVFCCTSSMGHHQQHLLMANADGILQARLCLSKPSHRQQASHGTKLQSCSFPRHISSKDAHSNCCRDYATVLAMHAVMHACSALFVCIFVCSSDSTPRFTIPVYLGKTST